MEYFTTSFNPTGNRLVDGCISSSDSFGTVTRTMNVSFTPLNPQSQMSEIVLNRTAVWAVGCTSIASQVVVSFDDMSVERYTVEEGGQLSNVTFALEGTAQRPLVATLNDSLLEPVLSHPIRTSNFSASVPVPDGGRLYISKALGVKQERPNGNDVTSISLASIASPRSGAQISFSDANQLWAVYSDATDDDSASKTLNILHYGDMLGLVYSGIKIMLEGDNQYFYEEFAPIFADVNGDGIDDVLTTVTEVNKGTALRWYLLKRDVGTSSDYDVEKQVVTSANEIDMHLVAMGTLGPNLQREVAAVETSNSARVRFYDAAQATLVAESDKNYTLFGSRNTDMVTVGDFDGDGVPEVVLQNNEKNQLYGLQRTPCGVNVAWQVDLPSPITTNIAASCNVMDSTMNIFFATEESLMRIEFAPSQANLTNVGAFAACRAAGGGDTSGGGAMHAPNVGLCIMCILSLQWLFRA